MAEPTILAIESSCDDTSAAVLKGRKVLSNLVANQDVHVKYGGVVPELASREHQKNIVPVVDQAMKKAGVSLDELNAIAYTRGPGLLGSLLVGSSFAKGLALSLDIPLIEVHHMHAHVMAHMIEDNEALPELPFLCLTVSGGHTQIVKVEKDGAFTLIGETQDDAAGEAFDKIAKLLGLPYPGGPEIDRLAREGDPHVFQFPIAKMPDYDYSFSGLKTAVLYFVQGAQKEDPDFVQNNINDICASVQYTIVKTLLNTFEKAARGIGMERVALAGGVSANSSLRTSFQNMAEQNNWTSYIPKFEYCTDNAAMIGISGYYNLKSGLEASLDTIPKPRMSI